MGKLLIVLSILGSVVAVLTAYKWVFIIIGLFKYRKYPSSEVKKRYGICVAARNEEKVIENFLESVGKQKYPLDKLTVFLMAHNCTDNTAAIAKQFIKEGLSIVVYEHNCSLERTKGYALKALFEKIEKDYGIEAFDGYFIFDADNYLAENYVDKMNDAFNAGNEVVTSFRASKNAYQNWLTYTYATHWTRTCLTENRGKSVLKQSCRVQGTGFLFANELVKQGWKYISLTEDRSFCTDVVLQNKKVSYCDEAIFYDEQPYRLKIAWRQRLRWAKGHLQSSVENCPKLFKKLFLGKNFTVVYDCFWLNFPRALEKFFRNLLTLVFECVLAVTACKFFGWWQGAALSYLVGLLKTLLGDLALQIAIYIVYRKRLKKEKLFRRILYAFTFPLFDLIGKWATVCALFIKIEWKPIPHDQKM